MKTNDTNTRAHNSDYKINKFSLKIKRVPLKQGTLMTKHIYLIYHPNRSNPTLHGYNSGPLSSLNRVLME